LKEPKVSSPASADITKESSTLGFITDDAGFTVTERGVVSPRTAQAMRALPPRPPERCVVVDKPSKGNRERSVDAGGNESVLIVDLSPFCATINLSRFHLFSLQPCLSYSAEAVGRIRVGCRYYFDSLILELMKLNRFLHFRLWAPVFSIPVLVAVFCACDTVLTSPDTNPATNITSSSATLGGRHYLTNDPARGISYWNTATPDILESVSAGYGGSPYTVNVTGLTPNSEYKFRAWISKGKETENGEQLSFRTLP